MLTATEKVIVIAALTIVSVLLVAVYIVTLFG